MDYNPVMLVPSLIITGCLLGSAAPTGMQTDGDRVALESSRTARAIVSRALDALGAASAITRAEGLALDGEGHVDLGTRLQGRRPFEGDRHPITERIASVPQAGRVVYEERAPINPDALSWQRTHHRADGT
jgi:hypothetical protein